MVRRFPALTGAGNVHNKRPRPKLDGLGLFRCYPGGESGIRAHDRVVLIPVFETVASIIYTVYIVDIDNDSRLKMEMMTI